MNGNLTQILGGTFDASEVELSEYEILPEGDYVLQVVDSEIKPTSKGGTQLIYTMQVVGTTHDGKQIKERLNIVNDNQKAVEIAFQTLAKISLACGVQKVNDSSDLHGKKFIAVIGIKKGEGTYIKDGVEKKNGDQNVIKKFAPMIGGQVQSTTTQSTSSSAAPEAKKMPWAK